MRTALDCIPCFARQTLEAARFVSEDPEVHERIVREVLGWTSEMDVAQSPPVVGQRIHRRLRELTGSDDPYREVKRRFNSMALAVVDELASEAAKAVGSFDAAVRLAIAGNVIDLGVNGDLTEDKARRDVSNALHEPFRGDLDGLRRAIDRAESILYLADNAGEIVFDRLLIEQMPAGRVAVVVPACATSSRSSTTARTHPARSWATAARPSGVVSRRPIWSSPRARETSKR